MSSRDFFAHTAPPPRGWEPLYCAEGEWERLPEEKRGHLNKVARLCARFAGEMFAKAPAQKQAERVGFLLGLWHDLGKFSAEFQSYLKNAGERADAQTAESGDRFGKVDHSTAGAHYAAREWDTGFNGAFLASLIAAHHAGLDNAGHLFGDRLGKSLCQWRAAAEASGVLSQEKSMVVPFSPEAAKQAGGEFCVPFLMRLFFSCLTDADALATEGFCNPERAALRGGGDTAALLEQMRACLESHFAEKFGAPTTPVNRARENVRRDCLEAAALPPGFFSLNVPTGGGKTLASLAFALEHARAHGLRRVIYVIPYASIIEQTARTFREVFAPLSGEEDSPLVLEHHSQVDAAKETEQSRLAAENWDAPLIVTTNVQFLESLFANRTSRCRKLHNIARSVVIFDEAQTLPAGLLSPILKALQCLVWQAEASVVLCTATQPTLEKRESFEIGIPSAQVREIIKDVPGLFRTLRRTRQHALDKQTVDTLTREICTRGGCGALTIVNTTRAAREVFAALRAALGADAANVRHLSAKMCPQHRTAVLDEVKRRLADGQPVWLVSTPLVEAGVDVSFPVVFRELCGMDSFAQSAGRCNRNGERGIGADAGGDVFLFEWESEEVNYTLPSEVSRAAAVSRVEVLGIFPVEDCLSEEAIRLYFTQRYLRAGQGLSPWDNPKVLEACGGGMIDAVDFPEIARRFKIIDQSAKPVIIPWDARAEELLARLRGIDRAKGFPDRALCRAIQRYCVNVFPNEYEKMKNKIENLCEGAFTALISTDGTYDKDVGLLPADEDAQLSQPCL